MVDDRVTLIKLCAGVQIVIGIAGMTVKHIDNPALHHVMLGATSGYLVGSSGVWVALYLAHRRTDRLQQGMNDAPAKGKLSSEHIIG